MSQFVVAAVANLYIKVDVHPGEPDGICSNTQHACTAPDEYAQTLNPIPGQYAAFHFLATFVADGTHALLFLIVIESLAVGLFVVVPPVNKFPGEYTTVNIPPDAVAQSIHICPKLYSITIHECGEPAVKNTQSVYTFQLSDVFATTELLLLLTTPPTPTKHCFNASIDLCVASVPVAPVVAARFKSKFHALVDAGTVMVLLR
jgi:hypothetical protein